MHAYTPTHAVQQFPAEPWYAPAGTGLTCSLQEAQPMLGQPSPWPPCYQQPFDLALIPAARSAPFMIEPYGSPFYAFQQSTAALFYAPASVAGPSPYQHYGQPLYPAMVPVVSGTPFATQFAAAPFYAADSIAGPSPYPHYRQPFHPATIPVAGSTPFTTQLYGSPYYSSRQFVPGPFNAPAYVAGPSPYLCCGQPLGLSVVPEASSDSFMMMQYGYPYCASRQFRGPLYTPAYTAGSPYHVFRQSGAGEFYTPACVGSPTPYTYYRQPFDPSLVRVAGGTPFIMQPYGSPSYAFQHFSAGQLYTGAGQLYAPACIASLAPQPQSMPQPMPGQPYPYYGQLVYPNLVPAAPAVYYAPPPFQNQFGALSQGVHLSYPRPTVISVVRQETSPAASQIASDATRQDEHVFRRRRRRHERMEAALSSQEHKTERADNGHKTKSAARASASVSAAIADPCAEACSTVEERPDSHIYRKYCDQVISKDIDVVAKHLLNAVCRRDKRERKKIGLSHGQSKRICPGLRGVARALRNKDVQCVLMATDMLPTSRWSLDDMVGKVLRLCSDKGVPVVFALKPQQYGNFVKGIGGFISTFGILSLEGVHQIFHELMQVVESARLARREREDNPVQMNPVEKNGAAAEGSTLSEA